MTRGLSIRVPAPPARLHSIPSKCGYFCRFADRDGCLKSGRVTKWMRAEPEELARLAQRYLDVSKDLFETNRALQGGAPLSTSDLGAFGESLHNAHTVALAEAGTALEYLIAVVETDCENLYRVVFAYEKADRDAAASFHKAGKMP